MFGQRGGKNADRLRPDTVHGQKVAAAMGGHLSEGRQRAGSAATVVVGRGSGVEGLVQSWRGA